MALSDQLHDILERLDTLHSMVATIAAREPVTLMPCPELPTLELSDLSEIEISDGHDWLAVGDGNMLNMAAVVAVDTAHDNNGNLTAVQVIIPAYSSRQYLADAGRVILQHIADAATPAPPAAPGPRFTHRQSAYHREAGPLTVNAIAQTLTGYFIYAEDFLNPEWLRERDLSPSPWPAQSGGAA